MHRSRLGNVIIDCQTDDLRREAEFWGAALGRPASRHSNDGRYIDLQDDAGDPQVILQKVDHPSRIHIDIETDDIEAEVNRLQKLGAVIVEKMARWTIMEAPSKHRFCIIGPLREDFEERANTWK